MMIASHPVELSRIFLAARNAVRAIPPAWPLEASVAVNPFLGLRRGGIAAASARLALVAGESATMPRDWFAGLIAAGTITRDDLTAAITDAGAATTVDALINHAQAKQPPRKPLPTVADVASGVTGTDWAAITVDRIGFFAAAHFDRGQAFWPAATGSAWRAWRATAMHDLAPEIAGLRGFAAFVRDLPEDPASATVTAIERLGIAERCCELYCHRLLVTLGGWAQLARQRQWQAQLTGGVDDTAGDLLAIVLAWELALHELAGGDVARAWPAQARRYDQPEDDARYRADALLQSAADHAAQRTLAATLAAAPAAAPAARPALQAVFCIDVRSELLRRALERQSAAIETFGFAGFFGMATAHRRAGSDVAEARLPALLAPPARSRASLPLDQDAALRVRTRAARAWGRFRLAAVSCFAFVEAAGPLYAAKLLRDGLALGGSARPAEPPPVFEPPLPPEQRIAMAENALRGISLVTDFAPIVLIVGHGADVVNNPHAAGLQCGACGGYGGDANARLLCGLLNDPMVRVGLDARGIAIPGDTVFVAGLHDTTSDAVTLFAADAAPELRRDLTQTRAWFDIASAVARAERSTRLPSSAGRGAPVRRGRDWAQVRPEWGLAGCHAFIAAPRAVTRGRDLGGRCFLHSYDRRLDSDRTVLDSILTAPVVVASWISLQYFGSTVAPGLFGSGNKLLHNAVGGVGVLEGNGGPMRAGLPWQSVSDGAGLAHQPVRLSVCIAAAPADIDAVLARHPEVRALFDDQWLHLFAMNDHGALASRYRRPGAWTAAFGDPATTLRAA